MDDLGDMPEEKGGDLDDFGDKSFSLKVVSREELWHGNKSFS